MFTFESFELVRGGHSKGAIGRAVADRTLLEIRKLGHHAVVAYLCWASQRIHVARRDETRGQLAPSAGGARKGRRPVLPSESMTSALRFS